MKRQCRPIILPLDVKLKAISGASDRTWAVDGNKGALNILQRFFGKGELAAEKIDLDRRVQNQNPTETRLPRRWLASTEIRKQSIHSTERNTEVRIHDWLKNWLI